MNNIVLTTLEKQRMNNKVIILLVILCILFTVNLYFILSTEHYRIARYEVTTVHGHRIYYDGGSIFINKFFYPIEDDLNLTKGDDILIHYLESYLGRTYIRIEKLQLKEA